MPTPSNNHPLIELFLFSEVLTMEPVPRDDGHYVIGFDVAPRDVFTNAVGIAFYRANKFNDKEREEILTALSQSTLTHAGGCMFPTVFWYNEEDREREV